MFNPVSPYRYLIHNVYFLWQIPQIQTCLCVFVGPGFVSTSPDFMRSSANHPSGPHGPLAQTTVNRAPLVGAGDFDPICTTVCIRCDSSTACRMFRWEPILRSVFCHSLHLINFAGMCASCTVYRKQCLDFRRLVIFPSWLPSSKC